MSLIFATQFSALATAVLAVFAVVTAVFAILAFRKQSKEVSDQAEMLKVQSDQLAEDRTVNAEQIRVLKLQADDLRESLKERQREAEERRRAQASRVFIEAGHQPPRQGKAINGVTSARTSAKIINDSNQPIYEAEIIWHDGALSIAEILSWTAATPVGVVMPGASVSQTTADPDARTAGVRFRDAADIRWVRSSDGHLADFL
jgi:hypothetical protein